MEKAYDHFVEAWLQDPAKSLIRSLADEGVSDHHPHITLVRPFRLHSSPFHVQRIVAEYCADAQPIPFTLEGYDGFGGGVHFVPVHSEALLSFSDGLERAIAPFVDLSPAPYEDGKTLHVTVKTCHQFAPVERIEDRLLRTTVIRRDHEGDKRIWFSWDHVAQAYLDREGSLDRERWERTLRDYSRV